MKDWWKMAIFHFKHSYLDWKIIPCKRRNDLCFCSFSSFCQYFFFASWFLFRPDQNFQVHDMTINFSFIFFYSHDLSAPGNGACYRWPSKLKHLFSVWGLFWKVGLLVHSCLYHFCPNRGLWLKSATEKWVIFGQHAPRH